MQPHHKSKKTQLFSTDIAAKSLFAEMSCDMEAILQEKDRFARMRGKTCPVSVQRDIRRRWLHSSAPALKFKAEWQMVNLFKEYRFTNDVYSDNQLSQMQFLSFCNTQQRLDHFQKSEKPLWTFLVLQEARKICRKILGDFTWDAMFEELKFGTKATAGNQRCNAYLENKISGDGLTASDSAWAHFLDCLNKDVLLSRCIGKAPEVHMIPVEQSSVPKSWKSLRGITPMQSINLALSFGMEYLVRNALRGAGLNIKTLQKRHARLVKAGSVLGDIATLDMSSASDSLTSELLSRILPRKWYRAILSFSPRTFSRSEESKNSKGKRVEKFYSSHSILLMGNAATFPVETLVFYCLAKAFGNLMNVEGKYSVYGDDIIVPSEIGDNMITMFEAVGVKVNREKTFVDGPFRESCGADYHTGIPVRPFVLSNSDKGTEISKNAYLSWLFIVTNGVLRRWSQYEVPRTIKWLLSEIFFVQGSVFRIPPHWGDDRGVRVDHPDEDFGFPHIFTGTPLKRVFEDGQAWYKLPCLDRISEKRFRSKSPIYGWDWLRSARHRTFIIPRRLLDKMSIDLKGRKVPFYLTSDPISGPEPTIRVAVKRKRTYRVGKKTVEKVRKTFESCDVSKDRKQSYITCQISRKSGEWREGS